MSTSTLERPIPQPEFDIARAEQFGQRAVQAIVDGFTSLFISVGYQAGLFDTLATLPPSTSAQVAAAANLQERYVREWLNGCTTAGITEFDAATKTYRLPQEHAVSLTRAAGVGNLSSLAQYASLAGSVEQQLLECFRSGGGVPYAAQQDFHRIHGEVTEARYDAALINGIVPLAPGLREKLKAGISVADIGCGSGYALCLLAEAFPNSTFTGYDFEPIALNRARDEARERGIMNVDFIALNVAEFDATEQFDLVTAFDAIHDQADPARVLANVQRAVKTGGTFLVADIAGSSNVENNVGNPLAPMLYGTSLFHCMTVSLAQGGAGLGTLWGEELAEEMFAAAGFREIAKHRVEGDIVNVYYVCTK